jgi:hypothetical protein
MTRSERKGVQAKAMTCAGRRTENEGTCKPFTIQGLRRAKAFLSAVDRTADWKFQRIQGGLTMATPVSALSLLGTSAPDQQIAPTANANTAVSAPPPATTAANDEDTVTVSSIGQQATELPTYLQVQQMSDAGETDQEIATALGISLQAVEAYFQTLIPAPSATDTNA